VVLNILVADGCYDINVAPDKREVFLKDEQLIMDQLQIVLTEWFDTMQRQSAFNEPSQQ
jgi:DNA mismatch repair ATPase MutL